MIPFDLHYGNPFSVYILFLVILFLVLYFRLYAFRQSKLKEFSDRVLLPRSRAVFWSKVAAIGGVWVFSTIALMQPLGNAHYPEARGTPEPISAEIKRKMHDVVFLVDASASMEIADSRTGETRFAYAKEIADEILAHLNGEMASLYAFTSKTTQMSPPTLNYLFVRIMLGEMRINEGEAAGTDLAEALGEIRENYVVTSPSKLTTVILLSDGGDTKLEHLPPSEKKAEVEGIVNLASGSGNTHLRLYTIGMGGLEKRRIPGFDEESGLQEDLLKRLARTSRGKYYMANDWSPLEIARDINSRMALDDPFLDEGKFVETLLPEESLVYDHYFQIPLGIAIFLLALALFLPETGRRRA